MRRSKERSRRAALKGWRTRRRKQEFTKRSVASKLGWKRRRANEAASEFEREYNSSMSRRGDVVIEMPVIEWDREYETDGHGNRI